MYPIRFCRSMSLAALVHSAILSPFALTLITAPLTNGLSSMNWSPINANSWNSIEIKLEFLSLIISRRFFYFFYCIQPVSIQLLSIIFWKVQIQRPTTAISILNIFPHWLNAFLLFKDGNERSFNKILKN